MIHKPIYKPKGAAAEYGDYALNIYTGCPHRCYYCYAPQVLHMTREHFHSCIEPRKDIVESVRRQLEREKITRQLIHLCFTCDPYPTGYDTTPTREIIKLLAVSDIQKQCKTCMYWSTLKTQKPCCDCWYKFGPAAEWKWRGTGGKIHDNP